jgi:hypothetical protein
MVTGVEEVDAASFFRAEKRFSETMVIIYHTTSETNVMTF